MRSAWAGLWLAVSLLGCAGVVGDSPADFETDTPDPESLELCPPEGCVFSCVSDSACGDPSLPLCEAGTCSACPTEASPDAQFVSSTFEPAGPVNPGTPMKLHVVVRNQGTAPWSHGCGVRLLGLTGTEELRAAEEADLNDDERVAPGATREFVLDLIAPNEPGTYTAEWQLALGEERFGPSVSLSLQVLGCQGDADCQDPGSPSCQSSACVPVGGPVTSEQALQFALGSCQAANHFVWPVPASRSICQAYHRKIAYQTCGFHTGLDICGPNGRTIVSAASGRVVYVGPLWYSGARVGRGPNAIVIQHGVNLYTTYSHNRRSLVKAGQCVLAGQAVAEMGSLGYSSGPHLHFEYVKGTAFTGKWRTPFANVCPRYQNPLSYAKP